MLADEKNRRTFSRGTAVDGIVTVNAIITGTPVDRLFVDVEVTMVPGSDDSPAP